MIWFVYYKSAGFDILLAMAHKKKNTRKLWKHIGTCHNVIYVNSGAHVLNMSTINNHRGSYGIKENSNSKGPMIIISTLWFTMF